MAFYRCDRGLGFDISNSTGTENDVLMNIRNNNLTYAKSSIFYNSIVHDNGKIRDYMLVDYKQNFNFCNNTTLAEGSYIVNNYSLKTDYSDSIIRKNTEIYDIKGSCEMIPRAAYNEKISDPSLFYKFEIDDHKLLSTQYNDKLYTFNISPDATLNLIITDLNLSLISKENINTTMEIKKLLKTYYSEEIDYLNSLNSQYATDPWSILYPNKSDAEIISEIERRTGINKSDCDIFEYSVAIFDDTIDVLNTIHSDNDGNLVSYVISNGTIGMGYHELFDKINIIGNKMIFKISFLINLDNIAKACYLRYHELGAEYISGSKTFTVYPSISSYPHHTFVILCEYDLDSGNISFIKHIDIYDVNNLSDIIDQNEPYLTTMPIFTGSTGAKIFSSCGKYIPSSHVYYIFNHNIKMLYKYDMQKYTTILSAKLTNSNNINNTGFYYDINSNKIFLVFSYRDETIYIEEYSEELSLIKQITISNTKLDGSKYAVLNLDNGYANKTYGSISFSNTYINGNTFYLYNMYITDDTLFIMCSLSRAAIVALYLPNAYFGYSMHTNGSANYYGILKISLDNGKLMDIIPPNFSNIPYNVVNEKNSNSSWRYDSYTPNNYLDHPYIPIINLDTNSNNYATYLNVRYQNCAVRYPLNQSLYTFTNQMSSMQYHTIVLLNGYRFIFIMGNANYNYKEYSHAVSLDIYSSIFYPLNNYNEINITNIDNTNDSYTDYYFN